MRFTVAQKVLFWLIGIALILIFLHIVTQYMLGAEMVEGNLKNYLLTKFNLDGEQVVGSWFGSTLLVSAAALLFIVGIVEYKRKNKQLGLVWASLGAIFVYLSIDEAISLHEALVEPVRHTLGIQSGIFFYAWIIPVMALLALFVIIYGRFWWSLAPKVRWLLALAFVIYVSGAIGMEMIAANYYSTHFGSWVPAGTNMVLIMLPAIEELCEMLGITVFIYGILLYMQERNTWKILS